MYRSRLPSSSTNKSWHCLNQDYLKFYWILSCRSQHWLEFLSIAVQLLSVVRRSTTEIGLYWLDPLPLMLIHYPAEVVSVIVSFLVSYCDFRQLLWIGRAGRSILTRVQILDIDGKYTSLGAKGYPFYYNHFSFLQRLTISLRFCSFRIYQKNLYNSPASSTSQFFCLVLTLHNSIS